MKSQTARCVQAGTRQAGAADLCQGFVPVGKGQLASGLSMVCAAGVAFALAALGAFFSTGAATAAGLVAAA